MNHLDEGQIQAFLDGQPTGHERAGVAEHLMVCGPCREVHDELRHAKELLSASVALLDPPGPGVAGRPPAQASARARLSTAAVKAAALVLLLAAAAAAAVPGSPLREWIVQVVEPNEPEAPVAEPAPAPLAPPEPTPPAVPMAALTGTVQGSGGRPLAFARVTVIGDTVSDWTDEAGTYRLEGPARESWRVRATHPGHEPLEQGVRLPGSGQASLDFSLQALPGPAKDPLADFQPFDITFTLPALLNTTAVTAAIELRYPADLLDRGVGGEAVLRLWLDEYGRVARSALSSSSGQRRLDAIALAVSREMRFRPAKSGDESVRVIVHIPVVFAPRGADGES
jgi:TonB family protein